MATESKAFNSDVKQEHRIFLLVVVCFVEEFVEVVQVFFHVPPRPEPTLVPVEKAVQLVLYSFFNDTSYDPISGVADRERAGV